MSRHAVPLWTLVFLWCALIGFLALNPAFTAASTQNVLSALTTRGAFRPAAGTGPGAHAAQASAAQENRTLVLVNHYLRKTGHVLLYSILGALLFLAWRATTGGVARSALLATPFGWAVAYLDETAQSLVPGRSSLMSDVCLDGVVLTAAILLLTWVAYRLPPRHGILQAVTLAETGGAQKVVYTLLQATADRWRTTLVTGPGRDLHRWAEGLSVDRHELVSIRVSPSPLADLRSLWHLVRLFYRTRPRIVHVHSSKMALLGRVAAWLTGVPCVIYTAHGWPIRDYHGRLAEGLYTWLERFGSVLTDRIVCVSEHEREMALRLRLAPAQKLTVIRNGVPQPPPERGRLRAALELPADLPLVVAVGRLAEPKDPLTFIRLAAMTPGARFVWLGDGPLRPDCERALAEQALQDRVALLGNRQDARILLNDADLVILPTRAEGLPLAVIEAMWAGKPVIASAVGGVPELIDHGETGFLCPPGDLEAMAGALRQLLRDPPLRRRMGEMARRRAEQNFSEQQMVRQYLALYEQALNASTR